MEFIVSDISYVSLALSLLCHLGFLVSFSFFWYKDIKLIWPSKCSFFFCVIVELNHFIVNNRKLCILCTLFSLGQKSLSSSKLIPEFPMLVC